MKESRLNGLLVAMLLLSAHATATLGQRQEERNRPTPGGVGIPEPFVPLILPSVALQPASENIVVDGNLDEASWRAAIWVSNFSEMWPGNLTEPPIDIRAGVTYDDTHLYVAFKVFDDPARVRATLTERDKIWRDDFVAVHLDTYGDGGWAYFLAANSIGVQGDSRLITGAEEEDESFDIIYDSEGRLTDAGYEVEMAIPFRSLRFPSGASQQWRVNFEVVHPRESRRVYTWSAIDRNDACMICQYGTIEGIENVRPGAGYELLPSLVGSHSASLADGDDPNSPFENQSVEIEPSLGVKYSVSSNLVADLTLNPDFSQVEADAAQIDVNESFALFFPEKRPFFQEGSDLYQTPLQTVYTRSINDPSLAAKLTGRVSGTNYGFIGASDASSPVIIPLDESSEFVSAGRSFSNIARVKRSFAGASNVGFQLTDRRFFDGGSGSTAGVDGQIRVSRSLQFSWQLVGSHTEEPNDPSITEDIDDIEQLTFHDGRHTVAFDGEQFSGYASSVGLGRNSRHWNFNMELASTSPTFRADNGFVTQTNRHRFFTWQNYSFWPKDSFFEQIRPHGFFGYETDFEGRRRDIFPWLGALIRTKGQTVLMFSRMLFSNEIFKGQDFRGIKRTWMRLESNALAVLGLATEWEFGQRIAKGEDVPVIGTGVSGDIEATIRPWSQLVFEPAFAYSRLENRDTGEELFDGYIFRLRSNYQATRRLIFRLITQYDRFDRRLEIDPLVTYRVNPFTAFYVGSTYDYVDFEDYPGSLEPTDRQFFFKVQYLVRS